LFSFHPPQARMADKVDGFIAVRMPLGVRRRLETASADLRRAGVTGDWQQGGTHHLTLKYMGEMESEKLDDIAEALREPCGKMSLPKFAVGPLFTFENQDGQAILAARVEPKEDLRRLFRVLERVTVACGGPESDFPTYKPHVTLCYLDEDGDAAWKDAKGRLDLPESFGELVIASVPLNEGNGAGSDFKVRRLVKLGASVPNRYHAAVAMLAAEVPAPMTQAETEAISVQDAAAAHTCDGCGAEVPGSDVQLNVDDEPYCGDCYDDKFAFCDDCGAELERGATGTTQMPNGDWYCRDCEPHVCSECDVPITRGEEYDCGDNTLCEGCFEEKCASCTVCSEVGFADDMAHAFDEWYCGDHVPPTCDSCGEYTSEDETHHLSVATYCETCYIDQLEYLVKDMWSDFYSDNPDLEAIDALQRAADEERGPGMTPGVYVRIFGDLDWQDAYGGDAWARIAETWRDLAKAVDEEEWDSMYLLVDHAFDLVHNNGSLFTKASEGVKKWLFKALEEKYFLDPLQYRDKLSGDARKLLDLHIRHSGGLAKWQERMTSEKDAMDRFTRAFRALDGKMAKRVWDMFGLNVEMFRGRDDFLDAAYWSQRPQAHESRKVGVLRKFLAAPSRESFLEALDAVDPRMCEPGHPHPASPVVRGVFVPKAMRLLETDEEFRRMMEQSKEDISLRFRKQEPKQELLFPSWQQGALQAWDSFFRARRERQREESSEATVVAGLRSAFLRLALSRTDFYDFYALSVVGCDGLPDDFAQMCRGMKKVTMLIVAKALLTILERAVVREARHVKRHLEVDE